LAAFSTTARLMLLIEEEEIIQYPELNIHFEAPNVFDMQKATCLFKKTSVPTSVHPSSVLRKCRFRCSFVVYVVSPQVAGMQASKSSLSLAASERELREAYART
jgi:hypothetical protein